MLHAVSTPDGAITLLLAGLLLVYLEFQRPGMIVVGAAGAFCALLALYDLAQMPLNPVAAVGVVAAFPALYFSGGRPSRALLSSGLLVVSLLHLLPHLRLGLIAAESTVFSTITILLARVAYRARQNKFRVGPAAAIGKRARSVTPLTPHGQVELFGQLWTATLRTPDQSLDADTAVLVHSAQGRILLVDAVPE